MTLLGAEAPAGIALVDGTGTIQTINPAIEHITGKVLAGIIH